MVNFDAHASYLLLEVFVRHEIVEEIIDVQPGVFVG